MNTDKEIDALLQLMDDPDTDVFEAVSNKLISYGTTIIPDLEYFWQNTMDLGVQERIELLIHRLHFTDLYTDFKAWAEAPHHELLPASLLITKFLYPDLQAAKVIQGVERLKRNIWLELNQYLTPLEQVNVFNSILYNYFGLKGVGNNFERANEFLIPNIIESKKGNQWGNGLLYLILAELLDLPVKAVPIPGQFVLGYFKSYGEQDMNKLHLNIEFFIEPTGGQIFTHNDLYNYLNRIEEPINTTLFIPYNNIQVMHSFITTFTRCFTKDEQSHYVEELGKIKSILS